jgi:hypothetical protein
VKGGARWTPNAKREGRPIAKDRAERLFEACRRLEEELDVDHASHAAYDACRARGIAADGSRRMAPGMVKAHEPVLVPAGLMNLSDHDSRPTRTHGFKPLQGYSAQLAVNEQQVVIAAELTCDAPDFGHLEPTVRATQRELRGVDVGDPSVVVADTGYWHRRRIETIVSGGIQVLVPPDSSLRRGTRPGWRGALRLHATRARDPARPRARSPRSGTIEPVFGQRKAQPRLQTLPTPWPSGMPVGMAAHRGDAQPPHVAPSPLHSRDGVRRRRRRPGRR